MNEEETNIQEMVAKVLASKKYHETGVNPATIVDLIHQETPKHGSQKQLLKAVRRKLHNIVAPYLGDPNYEELSEQLFNIPTSSPDSPEIKAFCREVLAQHASTRERVPYLETFYTLLFEKTGKPETVLDLACGLHPLSYPWMGLPVSVKYHAYDIIQPRIDFLNHFFQKIGVDGLAENRDILVNPPQIHADLGLFFKEAHRFEKRQPGCNRQFWASLKVDHLAISLPTQNLSGTHSLLDQQRRLIQENLPDDVQVEELLFNDEIIFLIDKRGD